MYIFFQKNFYTIWEVTVQINYVFLVAQSNFKKNGARSLRLLNWAPGHQNTTIASKENTSTSREGADLLVRKRH